MSYFKIFCRFCISPWSLTSGKRLMVVHLVVQGAVLLRMPWSERGPFQSGTCFRVRNLLVTFELNFSLRKLFCDNNRKDDLAKKEEGKLKSCDPSEQTTFFFVARSPVITYIRLCDLGQIPDFDFPTYLPSVTCCVGKFRISYRSVTKEG